MRVKSALAVISLAAAIGLTSIGPAEARWCRRGAPAGWCGPQPVRHFVYYPQYRNTYSVATFGPDPYPYVYMPRGSWPHYQRPYWRYWRRAWTPRRDSYYYVPAAAPVPAPMPVPVGSCCGGRYLK